MMIGSPGTCQRVGAGGGQELLAQLRMEPILSQSAEECWCVLPAISSLVRNDGPKQRGEYAGWSPKARLNLAEIMEEGGSNDRSRGVVDQLR